MVHIIPKILVALIGGLATVIAAIIAVLANRGRR